jgi:AcrR family transcriptional regulator
MVEQLPNPEARQRVLAAAERLFAERGYNSVTLRAIAGVIGIRHASLYHHAPGGKEQLYVEVVERNLRRHAAGLQGAMDGADSSLRAQLQGIAAWLLAQPPMDLVRMTHSDLPAIDPDEAQRLAQLAFEAIIMPVWRVLEAAHSPGALYYHNLGLVIYRFTLLGPALWLGIISVLSLLASWFPARRATRVSVWESLAYQ